MSKCTAKRKDGVPCRAWAMAHTDPPRCRAHAAAGSEAARPGEADALGNVGRRPPEALETIEGIIADLAEKQSRLSQLIDDELVEEQSGLDVIRWLFTLHGQNATRLGRLLRDKRALSGAAADGVEDAVSEALDELSKGLGVEL
jgi:hypothetical protein